MRVFVTGGSGFIGAAFVNLAVETGHDLTVLAREPSPWRIHGSGSRLRLVSGELSDPQVVSRALEETRPDGVVHLGWAGVSGSDRNAPMQISNIEWSTGLLLASANAGARFFVSTGSQAEYGPRSGIISPGDETRPTTLYGECKLATYHLLNRLAEIKSMRLGWLRVFSTYGPKDHPYWMIPGLIGGLLEGRRPPLTLGEQKWDFLHVNDAARAILAVCESDSAAGVFNLGSGSAPTLRNTVEMIRDLIDPRLPLGFGDVPYRPDQVMHLQADTTRLARELDWQPQVTLADGLAETVQWYRDNRWIFDA